MLLFFHNSILLCFKKTGIPSNLKDYSEQNAKLHETVVYHLKLYGILFSLAVSAPGLSQHYLRVHWTVVASPFWCWFNLQTKSTREADFSYFIRRNVKTATTIHSHIWTSASFSSCWVSPSPRVILIWCFGQGQLPHPPNSPRMATCWVSFPITIQSHKQWGQLIPDLFPGRCRSSQVSRGYFFLM